MPAEEIINHPVFITVDEAIKEAADINADIVAVCSSDNEYISIVPEILSSLGNKAIITIAGNPQKLSKLADAGIKHFINKNNIVKE